MMHVTAVIGTIHIAPSCRHDLIESKTFHFQIEGNDIAEEIDSEIEKEKKKIRDEFVSKNYAMFPILLSVSILRL